MIWGFSEGCKVKVLWFQEVPLEAGRDFERIFEDISPNHQVLRAASLPELGHSLAMPGKRPQVAVLVISDHEVLDRLVGMSDYFAGIRTVLLLPDLNRDTVGQALSLRPSYYDSYLGQASCVRSVLDKIAARS